ncbi:16S rRNA (uracil(1498)-N(3))-methyltransferase [Marinovum sp. 2_MG-2023]|uniref:16S rRNA (uracil(1498)-N(3))-methyltransferase n=1 Tax=Roseobacteraceae TaxID=2854170 RepID=UPI001FD0DE34|nr:MULTISPECIES: 16S rRNA (uracil(1498)-N(3))-methyltransferase [Roseobacteraceae]MCJ7871629.1 16S rRNA (uracil(1498)-N(3))-methyltransferase [Phaeobacter sp. J2-8]MDO6728462.1 16S rRNA (uracil(1498)-N(3))-methyltransferase [Marinovum sp. 2_MG-2023]MDO6778122.1 16S rRNA (uracil(1498)-N(3))-methyltransferase [Marinovum sp. 1_MG-2023]
MSGTIRLYVEHALGQGQTIPLTREQAHYLFGVMRLTAGAQLLLFNGQDGEWRAEVVQAGKRGGILICQAQTKEQGLPPDLWLLFAPVKKARTDFIVEKAVEMGVRRIVPVQSEFTNSDRIRADKQRAHAIEAAEQCGATFVPDVADIQKLSTIFDNWPAERKLMFCDETRVGGSLVLADLIAAGPGPWAILIGPEGGFSASEHARLRALDFAHPVALGPRILRAETAAVAALTLWQMALGDWR